jgi:hypothetical protein
MLRLVRVPHLWVLCLGLFATTAFAETPTASIKQVAVYQGATRHQLFEIYADAKKHSAATHPASGEIRFVDPETGKNYPRARVGLRLEGFYQPPGSSRTGSPSGRISQVSRRSNRSNSPA